MAKRKNADDFITHKMAVLPATKPLKCSVCAKRFKEKRNLENHIRTHYDKHSTHDDFHDGVSGLNSHQVVVKKGRKAGNEKNGNMPTDSSKEPDRTYIAKKIQTDGSGGVHKCKVCEKEFQQQQELYIHVETHIHDRSRKCGVCGLQRAHLTPAHLMQHIVNHTKATILDCKICGSQFIKVSDYTKHLALHAKPIDPVNNKCTICGKELTNKQNLKSHMIVHSTEKPFRCEICNKCFNRQDTLKWHLETHSETKYPCSQCEKVFNVKRTLIQHIREAHIRGKVFKCTYCTHACLSQSDLKSHMRVHSGEKPFACTICRRRFRTSSQRMSHMISHSDERPYKCSTCGKAYKNRGELKIHMIKHTGEKNYKCDVCGKRFWNHHLLKAHVEMHRADKPYKCSICGMGSKRRSDLQKHLRTHSGEKPFPCPMCPQRFTESSNLAVHKRKYHGIGKDQFKKCPVCKLEYKNLQGHMKIHKL